MSKILDFDLSDLALNVNGWGPAIDTKNAAAMIPFQSFNKSDRLGMIADWTGDTYSDKRALMKYQVQFSRDQYNAEDDEAFQLVDQTKNQRPANRRNIRMANKNFRNQRNQRGGFGGNMQVLRKNNQQNQRNNNQRNSKFGNRPGNRRYDQNKNAKKRDASVNIRPEWKILEELDFPRLGKLSLPNISEGEDLYSCGAVEYYDKTFDRVTCKNEKRLQRINRLNINVTTTDDPIVRQLTKTSDCNVFATDSILSTLMCATRSVTSWDIVVQRLGDKLFFDKREDSEFNHITVNETAAEVQFNEDNNSINHPRALALEATFINHNFSQQVLKRDDPNQKYSFNNPNPFITDDQKEEPTSVAYRYRKYDLGNDIKLLARCQHDAATIGGNGDIQFMSIHALNEYDSRIPGAIDWRQKLDIQRGAVLANELKNNSCKLAKWTTEAILSGSDHLKFGYVSRINFRDSVKHTILGTQQFKPREFADQIALKLDNAWGVLRCIIDMCMKLPNGKYLILKDPNKGAILIYDIPDDTFEGTDDEDSEEEIVEAEEKN